MRVTNIEAGTLYSDYSTSRRNEKITSCLSTILCGGTLAGILFPIVNHLREGGYAQALRTVLEIPQLISDSPLPLALVIPTAAFTIDYFIKNRTNRITGEIARLEHQPIKDNFDLNREKGLNDKAVAAGTTISPKSAKYLQVKEEQLREQATIDSANEERQKALNGFDGTIQALFWEDTSRDRQRKEAGALELARFGWRNVLDKALSDPTIRDTEQIRHTAGYTRTMLSQIGSMRAKLPSRF